MAYKHRRPEFVKEFDAWNDYVYGHVSSQRSEFYKAKQEFTAKLYKALLEFNTEVVRLTCGPDKDTLKKTLEFDKQFEPPIWGLVCKLINYHLEDAEALFMADAEPITGAHI